MPLLLMNFGYYFFCYPTKDLFNILFFAGAAIARDSGNDREGWPPSSVVFISMFDESNFGVP